jgi:hypothetical protein
VTPKQCANFRLHIAQLRNMAEVRPEAIAAHAREDLMTRLDELDAELDVEERTADSRLPPMENGTMQTSIANWVLPFEGVSLHLGTTMTKSSPRS